MSASLRILHCLRAPVGGLFRHVCDLAIAQNALGHQVGVVCDAASGDALTAARLGTLEPHLALGLVRTPMSREVGPRDFGAYSVIRATAARHAVDVVHGHGAKGGAYARLAARSLNGSGRRPIRIYTPHGGSLHYDPATLQGLAYMALERGLARLTDGIVFESAYSAGLYDQHVGATTGRSRVIPNGLLPGEFACITASPGAADFGFVGELRHIKGADVMLRALARVCRKSPVRAIIAGDGPEARPLRALAVELGIAQSVGFAEPLPAREAFKMAHALVVPSRAESLPYIVLEAAAAGLPLLATNVGGIPEIVTGTDTALLPPDDDAQLAAAMLANLAAPEAARQRAIRLRTAVSRRFTVAAMTGAILDFYAACRDS